MPNNTIDLIETWRMQWVLLQMAVQLDQHWTPSLRQQSEAAVRELFSIVRKLGGMTDNPENLGELRKHMLEQIIKTGSMLAERLSIQTARSLPFGHRRRRAEDILFIARTLDRCVALHSCELTDHSRAQRALWSCISTTRDRAEPPRRGEGLLRHVCSHAMSELEDWLEEERANAERTPDAVAHYRF